MIYDRLSNIRYVKIIIIYLKEKVYIEYNYVKYIYKKLCYK